MKFSLDTVLKKITSPSFLRAGQPFSPHRDWRWALISFLVLMVGFILWSSYLFWQIRTGDLFGNDPTPLFTAQVLDRSVLREVLLHFEEQENRYDTLLNDSSPFPNPLQ